MNFCENAEAASAVSRVSLASTMMGGQKGHRVDEAKMFQRLSNSSNEFLNSLNRAYSFENMAENSGSNFGLLIRHVLYFSIVFHRETGKKKPGF